MKRALSLLRSEHTYKVLVALNILVSTLVVVAFQALHGNDRYTYFALADSLLHGTYSLYWQLPVEVPDTFRNPGYPLFLAIFRAFTDNVVLIQLVQVALYALAVHFILRSLRAMDSGLVARNIFLLLLLPSINILYYHTGIHPEPLATFLIAWVVFVEVVKPDSYRRALTMALIVGAAFQFRSTLLLLPAFWFLSRWLFDRKRFQWRTAAMFAVAFVCTTLPYAFWNLSKHGVLQPTPLEGGGGALHAGWWSGKIPGHTEHWYWGNSAAVELIPMVARTEVQANISAFEDEWRRIDSALQPLLTQKDSIMLDAYSKDHKLFRAYNTRYTLAREKALKEVTLQHMVAEPGYTLRYKSYSAIRLWVTGMNMDRFKAAGWAGRIAEVYPFLLTLSIFLLALVIVPIALWKHKELRKRTLPLLIWVVYFGLIHIPFSIQARYTIPVRLLLFALIALCLARLLSKTEKLDTAAKQ